MSHSRQATLIGYLSIMIWSSDAVMTTYLRNIPSFQVVTGIFSMGFLFLLLRSYFSGQLAELKQPDNSTIKAIIIASLCLFGTHFFYIQAFKYSQPIFADLINYLWPLYLFMLSMIFHGKRPTRDESLGLFIATLGILILFWPKDIKTTHTIIMCLKGYGYALLAGFSWAFYNLYFSDSEESLCINTMTLNFGLIALLALLAHLSLETFLVPSLTQVGIICFLAIFSVTLGYFFWNYGIQFGNNELLSVLSYQTPMFSVFWLFLFGKSDFSLQNIISSILITAGAYLCLKVSSDQKKSPRQTLAPT